jgi:hypothetical protein
MKELRCPAQCENYSRQEQASPAAAQQYSRAFDQAHALQPFFGFGKNDIATTVDTVRKRVNYTLFVSQELHDDVGTTRFIVDQRNE